MAFGVNDPLVAHERGVLGQQLAKGGGRFPYNLRCFHERSGTSLPGAGFFDESDDSKDAFGNLRLLQLVEGGVLYIAECEWGKRRYLDISLLEEVKT